MKFLSKELFIAILLGFVVGLIVTYGIWTANQAIQQKENSISPVPTDIPDLAAVDVPELSSEDSDLRLKIAQPDANTLTNLDNLVVTGITDGNANVLVFGEKDWELVVADDQGQFSANIALISGINYIKVTVINDQGQQLSANRTVVYSTTEI